MSVNGQDFRGERLPARRHAPERLHERAGGQRRQHGARHRDDPGIPRRNQLLQRRVRPQRRRPGPRDHQVRHQHFRGSAYLFHRNDALDARTSSTPPTSRTSGAINTAPLIGGPTARPLFFFVGYVGTARAPRADDRPLHPRPQRPPRPPPPIRPPDADHRCHPRSGRSRLSTRAPTAPRPAAASPPSRSRSGRPRRGFLPGTARPPARPGPSPVRAAIPTTRLEHCCDGLPAVPAHVPVAKPVLLPVNTARSLSQRTLQQVSPRVQPHPRRPARAVEHDVSRWRRSFRGANRRRHRHRRHPAFRAADSVNIRLVQKVISGQYDQTQTRGQHLLKAGALVERYQMNMINPTFSLGIYTFSEPAALPPEPAHPLRRP